MRLMASAATPMLGGEVTDTFYSRNEVMSTVLRWCLTFKIFSRVLCVSQRALRFSLLF